MSDTYDYTAVVQDFDTQTGGRAEWQNTTGRAYIKSIYSSQCKVNSEIAFLLWVIGNPESGYGGVEGQEGVNSFFRYLDSVGVSREQAQKYVDQAKRIKGTMNGDNYLAFAAQLALEELCAGLRPADVVEALDKKYKAELIDFVKEDALSDLTPVLIKQTEDTIDCVTESVSIIDDIIKMIDDQFYGKILPAFGAQSAAKRLVQRSASDLSSTGISGAVARSLLRSSTCLLYTSPSPRDRISSRMPSSA